MRLDQYLKHHNYFESRHKATIAIKEGAITVDDQVVYKPSFKVNNDSSVQVIKKTNPYVSQGGKKLEKALYTFDISLEHLTVLDIGASTGGFSDCALKHQAKKIYALDVGSNQLHESLLQDERIMVMENTNFLSTTLHDYPDIDFVMCDVSFISGIKILSHLKKIGYKGEILILVKPQFESMKTPKSGVIKDPKLHKKILDTYLKEVKALGFEISNLCESPILGQSGNKEFLLYLNNGDQKVDLNTIIE